ncbi:MAG: 16S rRNA (guanine(527)-N(7))-methyltransferase RsmG [Bdellovibrio sp. CG10_big_fil_rev_8_21_14_0_10_47_8]|nr:MAG: 16S rRNA (guanine(527)-N(7))-methyltransferase RsmG [Bdellovibrio sp. CG10_big_fil_rev_8_21_14_0_10_47_8]
MAHKNKSNISPYKTQRPESATTPRDLRGKHKKPQQIYSVEEANDRLADIFRNHNFTSVSHTQRQQLAHFYRLLMESQEKENFTRLLTIKDIGIRHFIDCLIVPQLTELQFPLMDLGSGPGFPGIPLKIFYPDQKIILAEGVQRRVEFLKSIREKMQLQKLDIIGRNINPYFAYPVQGVITRAVEDVRNTLNNVLTSLQTGGRVYFMKGPKVDPELAVAEKEVGEFYTLEKDIAYTLPETSHQRRLLVYRKIKMAPLPDFDEEPWPEDGP